MTMPTLSRSEVVRAERAQTRSTGLLASLVGHFGYAVYKIEYGRCVVDHMSQVVQVQADDRGFVTDPILQAARAEHGIPEHAVYSSSEWYMGPGYAIAHRKVRVTFRWTVEFRDWEGGSRRAQSS